jgi:hypothetical protein
MWGYARMEISEPHESMKERRKNEIKKYRTRENYGNE